MIPDHITSQIETWITKVLDSPNSKFGNLPPCPYAKKAWVEGNVSVKMFDDVQSFTPQDWDKEVNIYVMNPWISSELLSEMAKNYNSMYSDYLFLEEHPDLIERYLGSVVASNDNYFAALNSAVFSDGSFVFIPSISMPTPVRVKARMMISRFSISAIY